MPETKNSTSLDIWPPIRLVSMGVICIAGLVYLPNVWWGLITKVLLGIWLLATLAGSFGKIWEEYETMGAFVTFQLAAFAALMLSDDNSFVTYGAVFVIILGWLTMLSHMKRGKKKSE